jgi:hypothetical protein
LKVFEKLKIKRVCFFAPTDAVKVCQGQIRNVLKEGSAKKKRSDEKYYYRPSDFAKVGRLDCNKALIQTQ